MGFVTYGFGLLRTERFYRYNSNISNKYLKLEIVAAPAGTVPSRAGRIIKYNEWCAGGKEINVYENELITKRSSDGNVYTMTAGDWECYEKYLQEKR